MDISGVEQAQQQVRDAELAVLVAARRLQKALSRVLIDHAETPISNVSDVLASLIVGAGATMVGEAHQQLQLARATYANRQALAYQRMPQAAAAAADSAGEGATQ